MALTTSKMSFVVNGQTFKSLPGGQFDPGGIDAEEVISDQDTVDSRERLRPSMAQCTVVHDGLTSITELQGQRGVTLNVETNSGVVYTVDAAFIATTGSLSNGTFDVTIKGPPAIEQLAG